MPSMLYLSGNIFRPQPFLNILLDFCDFYTNQSPINFSFKIFLTELGSKMTKLGSEMTDLRLEMAELGSEMAVLGMEMAKLGSVIFF